MIETNRKFLHLRNMKWKIASKRNAMQNTCGKLKDCYCAGLVWGWVKHKQRSGKSKISSFKWSAPWDIELKKNIVPSKNHIICGNCVEMIYYNIYIYTTQCIYIYTHWVYNSIYSFIYLCRYPIDTIVYITYNHSLLIIAIVITTLYLILYIYVYTYTIIYICGYTISIYW